MSNPEAQYTSDSVGRCPQISGRQIMKVGINVSNGAKKFSGCRYFDVWIEFGTSRGRSLNINCAVIEILQPDRGKRPPKKEENVTIREKMVINWAGNTVQIIHKSSSLPCLMFAQSVFNICNNFLMFVMKCFQCLKQFFCHQMCHERRK